MAGSSRSRSSCWEEVKAVNDENKRELTLQGSDINSRIVKLGLDENVFALVNLNFLKIAGTPLESISPHLQKLENLTSLLLDNNKLKEIPSTIGNLNALKVLDVSGNRLTSLPDELSQLTNLESLNANLNLLTSFPNISKLTHLAYLSLSRNKLTTLPEGICDEGLGLLSTVDAANNEIQSLPSQLSNLSHLNKLDVSANKLDSLPPELSECMKLKELVIFENKMKDRKLLKLAEHSTKSLLNYLGVQLEKQRAAEGDKQTKGGKKTNRKKKKGGKSEVDEIERDLISVLQFEADAGLTISATPDVLSVRQYIVCCIIRHLDFSKSVNMFKRFINLQTKMHETVCDKRNAATIATHDLKLVKAPLVYDAVLPSEITITPLFKSKSTTAEELMKSLRDEAEAFRKEKKRSTLSGIHKYLDLLKDKAKYPCLRDSDGDVISFPPITNSEKTKISKETTDILLEVTSSVSLEMCKKVIQETLQATLLTGVGTPAADNQKGPSEVEDGEGAAPEEATEAPDMSRVRVPQKLTVEQVKVVDSHGNLRVIYPSRVDLQSPAFDVIRNYE